MIEVDALIPWALPAALCLLTLLCSVLARRQHRRQRRQILDNLARLQLLRSLMADLQRHRGLSTALLAGEARLKAELNDTRSRLDHALVRARELAVPGASRWQALSARWQVLREVRGRDLQDNLREHNRIIDDCICLIEDSAGEVDLAAGHPPLAQLDRIWQLVVPLTEWSGQARALGTSMAASGRSSAAQRIRLRFLQQRIRVLSEQAFAGLAEADGWQGSLQQCRRTLEAFTGELEHKLLASDTPCIDARQYFTLATGAINALLGLIDAALNDLQQLHGAR